MEHLADTIGENRFARQKKGKEKRKERERIVDRYSFDDIEGSLQFFFLFVSFWVAFIFRSLVFQLSNRLKIRGDGFSPDILARMFSKFFDTKRWRRRNLDDETSVQQGER